MALKIARKSPETEKPPQRRLCLDVFSDRRANLIVGRTVCEPNWAQNEVLFRSAQLPKTTTDERGYDRRHLRNAR